MRKNLPRGRLVVALDAPHSASIAPRSAEPKPARIVHICPRAVCAAAVGVRIAALGQVDRENYCWRPGRALRASQPGSGRAGGPRAASQKAFRMVPGCWAVPAVPTGSRLSSGRPAVTALVPLRNLLGHWPCLRRSRPGSAMAGRSRGEWSYRRLRRGHRPESDGLGLAATETRSCPNRKRSRHVTAAVSPTSPGQLAWRAPGRRARLGAAAARWAAPAPNGRRAGRPVVPLDRSGGRGGRA